MKTNLVLTLMLILLSSCNEFIQSESGSDFMAAPVAPPTPPASPEVNVPETPGQMIDTFTQTAEGRGIDILWVVDDSGSMGDDQIRLGSNFNAFIQDFVKNSSDFQMAITTTDTTSEKRGLMVPGSDLKLNSVEAKRDPAQFMEDFKQLIFVDTKGSGSERGLEATKGFLENYADSFLREDAFLAVVIVSDEEDQSREAVSHYVDLLKSQKSNPNLVKIYAIVKDSRSTRYKESVAQTNGTHASIDSDFAATLKDMGTSLFELTNSFPLSKKPIPESMKVLVDGREHRDYIWNSTNNTIEFSANSLPPEGSQIRLVYDMAE